MAGIDDYSQITQALTALATSSQATSQAINTVLGGSLTVSLTSA